MKHLFIILTLGTIITTAMAQEEKSPERILNQAAEQYSQADYERAIELYQSLLAQGYADPKLYYNLGNAYFKNGDLGKSILFYERAYLLQPEDPEIAQNLKIARARIRDRVEPIPLLVIVKWWNDLKTTSSASTLFLYSTILAWLLAGAIFLFYGFRNVLLRRVVLALGIVLIGLFAASVALVQAKNESLAAEDFGIIMPFEVIVHSTPDATAVESFKIHEGLKVEVLEEKDGLVRIRLADGKQGWISANELVLI
ncbi:MAG: hypothetical protein CL946_07645 [Ectothiorhodospiraceae bacterium]|nr:hypothetical protein [Ectothiorhodospiraceae bacterium]